MALSVNQTSTSTGASAGASVSAAAINQPAGHLIVAAVRWNPAAPTSISNVQDTAGNTYVNAITNTSVAGEGLAIYYVANCLGNAANIVKANFNNSSSSDNGIFVWDIVGAATTSPLDQTAHGGSATAALSGATGQFTTQNPNEIACTAATSGAVNQTFSGGGSAAFDATFPSGTGGKFAGAQHQIFSSIQTNTTQSMSWTGNAAWAIVTATFTQAAAPPAGGTAGWIGTHRDFVNKRGLL